MSHTGGFRWWRGLLLVDDYIRGMVSRLVGQSINHFSTMSPAAYKVFTSIDSLRYECVRLSTFINWPHESWLKAADLAEAGFYYLRISDHTACAFCRGIVGSWEREDTIRGEHQRHFPQCPFIRDIDVGNFPKECKFTPIQTPLLQLRSTEGTEKFLTPIRKDFLTVDLRINSFVKWPPISQNINDLAMAGFFCCNLSDYVRCFHCNIGIRNWESEDDPWIIHARYSPNCVFMMMTKGRDFIEQHQPPISEEIEILIKTIMNAGIPDYFISKKGRMMFKRIDRSLIVDKCFYEYEQWQQKRKKQERDDLIQKWQPRQCDKYYSHNEDIPPHHDDDCVICMNDSPKIIFLPCKHMVSCYLCASSTDKCPMCRQEILEFIRPTITLD